MAGKINFSSNFEKNWCCLKSVYQCMYQAASEKMQNNKLKQEVKKGAILSCTVQYDEFQKNVWETGLRENFHIIQKIN